MEERLKRYTIEELLKGIEHESGGGSTAKQAAREELKTRGYGGFKLAGYERHTITRKGTA